MRDEVFPLGVAVAVAVLALSVPVGAEASDGKLFDWSEGEAPVLVSNDDGLIFLGTDREPWRAYSWDRADAEGKSGVYFPDMDQDGDFEVVGAGDPSFSIDHSSAPNWVIDGGCKQLIVANFEPAEKLDVMCHQGTSIDIYTHDLQKFWSLDVGASLDYCSAADINGDLNHDIECKYAGEEAYIRLDSQGKILAQKSEKSEIAKDGVDLEEATPTSVLGGDQEFDLNGDGTAEESITADGSAIVLQSRSKEKAVARVELGGSPQAALVKNLDKEGTPEIVVLTDDQIHVVSGSGEKLGSYSADASDYERYPVADLQNVYARNFGSEGNSTVKKNVEGVQEELAECYSDQVKGNLFVGTGQVVTKVHVGKSGDVDEVELMHSAINDDAVTSCTERVLKSVDYPETTEGQDSGSVNVTLKFTFADKT